MYMIFLDVQLIACTHYENFDGAGIPRNIPRVFNMYS
jgi:hypothetical protein